MRKNYGQFVICGNSIEELENDLAMMKDKIKEGYSCGFGSSLDEPKYNGENEELEITLEIPMTYDENVEWLADRVEALADEWNYHPIDVWDEVECVLGKREDAEHDEELNLTGLWQWGLWYC